jgi:cytochrome c oxidase assembly factor CtaG
LISVVYTRGWIALRPLRSTLLPGWRLACLFAGLAALWLAVASPLDAFAGFLLTFHMIQHLLLMLVAPPLILLASPQIPLLRGLPLWAARDALGPFFSWPPLQRFGRVLTHPTVCWLAAVLTLLAWHIPAAYDLALASPSWHGVEHASLFVVSLLFWWPVIQPWPTTAHWPRWSIPAYLLAADLVANALAAILSFSEQPLYRAYARMPRLFGWSHLADQSAAGALMWVFGSFILLSTAAFITLRILDPPPVDRKRQIELSWSRLARPARVPFDLLRLPIVGTLLRAPYGRIALQAVLLLITAAVIADGFIGHPMGPMNLAGVVPWTYGRVLVVVALLTAGNFFCMACPFTLPREAGRRLGFATRRWPQALRTKWLAVALMVLFFWAYEAFDLWNTPFLTACILTTYFVAAFAVDTFFRGASFCKYVCPIGQFNFIGSLVSPLEVRIRRLDACTTCAAHDCLRGNPVHRGCELQLFLPRKVGNMDCTFCLDCVKACPHDNVGILAAAPGRDLTRDPLRSSLGRFSRRPDIAVLALVVVSSAFVNAAAMLEPVVAWRNRVLSTAPVTALYFLVALLLAPMLLVGGTALAGRRLSKSARPIRELFCRYSLALLPVGLAMWTAHLLFHLSTAWSSLWPVLQRASIDLGVGWLGAPHWRTASSILSTDTLLACQILVLDLGLLLSLYLGWRIAAAYSTRVASRLPLLAPWATLLVGLYIAGIWVFLQPMQMRGMVHG